MKNPGLARAPLGWLLALALSGVVVLWQLPENRSSSPRPAVPVHEAAPTAVPAPEPLVRAERLPAPISEPAAPPVELTGHLVVRVVAPAGTELGGMTRVEVRHASGDRVAVLELNAASPSAGLDCEPGEYELALDHPGPPVLGALPERIVLRPGVTEHASLTLAPLWRLSGRLTDERALGLEDVRIALARQERVVSEDRTRPGGTFVLPPLPENDYVLVVGDPLGPILPPRSLRLDGRLGELELRVPVLLELEVRVLDEQGLPVPGAEVEGTGERGGRVAGVTDPAGSLRAALLPPGNYRLFARHPTLGRGNKIFALSGEPPAPLEIRLLTGRPQR